MKLFKKNAPSIQKDEAEKARSPSGLFARLRRKRAEKHEADPEPLMAEPQYGTDQDPGFYTQDQDGYDAAPFNDEYQTAPLTDAQVEPEPETGKRPGLAERLRNAIRPKKGGTDSSGSGDALKRLKARKSNTTSPDISKPDTGVLAFGNKKVAIGVQWISPEEGQSVKQSLAHMTETSQNDPTQLSATYRFYTDERWTGFMGVGSPDLGHKVGMKALVTMLSPEITGPRWIGAFPIDGDNWWVGSMRDGKIFEDQILGSRSLAEQTMMNNLQAPDWTGVFCPLDWGIREGRPDQLYELVNLRLGQKFKSSTPVRDNLPRAILGLVVVGAGAFALNYYQEQQAEQQRQLEEMRRKAEQGMTFGPSDLPWYQVTDLKQFIASCTQEISKALITVPGWENQPISCAIRQGAGTVATGWARSGGRSAWIRAAVPPEKPQPVLSADSETAAWTIPFIAPVMDGEMSVQPWDQLLIENRLKERFQNFEMQLAIRPSQGNQPNATNQVLFNSHEIRLTSTYGMANFGDMLSDVPAIVPDALIYSPATGAWDLALKVFHPPLIPPQAK